MTSYPLSWAWCSLPDMDCSCGAKTNEAWSIDDIPMIFKLQHFQKVKPASRRWINGFPHQENPPGSGGLQVGIRHVVVSGAWVDAGPAEESVRLLDAVGSSAIGMLAPENWPFWNQPGSSRPPFSIQTHHLLQWCFFQFQIGFQGVHLPEIVDECRPPLYWSQPFVMKRVFFDVPVTGSWLWILGWFNIVEAMAAHSFRSQSLELYTHPFCFFLKLFYLII